jgi:hypothetical protein
MQLPPSFPFARKEYTKKARQRALKWGSFPGECLKYSVSGQYGATKYALDIGYSIICAMPYPRRNVIFL